MNEHTKIELGLVITLVSAIIAAIIAGTVWCTKISIGQRMLSDDLTELRHLFQAGMDDRWRRSDMQAWVERANREVELWSREAEDGLGMEPGSLTRFHFPDAAHD